MKLVMTSFSLLAMTISFTAFAEDPNPVPSVRDVQACNDKVVFMHVYGQDELDLTQTKYIPELMVSFQESSVRAPPVTDVFSLIRRERNIETTPRRAMGAISRVVYFSQQSKACAEQIQTHATKNMDIESRSGGRIALAMMPASEAYENTIEIWLTPRIMVKSR
jgi:hypothetical protein